MCKEKTFSGKEHIPIFDFLTILTKEAEELVIGEGQLMVLLPHFLDRSAADQYRGAANGSSSGNVGGIVHWSEAVHHLMRTYTTKTGITEGL